MTKKTFLSIAMVFLGLLAGTNTAWASNMTGMTDAQAETLGFWARLTAKPATTTTGSGTVFVSEDDHEKYPTDGDYAPSHSVDGFSDVFVQTSFIDGDVHYKVYAKPAAGSYFTGWSFTDGYSDLGTENNGFPVKVTPSSKSGHDKVREYFIYAAFESVKLVSYQISGVNSMTPSNHTCTQTVTFRAETPGGTGLGSVDDVKHFKLPVITPKAGTTGTWSTSVTEWELNTNISLYGQYAVITVPVKFTAPNGDPGEYGAELVLETYAGVKMKVYLSARTTDGSGEAIRYNKSKVQQETGDLSTLLSNAAVGDIIKLNKAYASPVTLNKDLTFDLNGYTLSNTLTVSGGNVTLAYSPYGGDADALNVTGGKAILNGGTFGSLTIEPDGTVEQNGATITGAATNNGVLTTTDGIFQSGLTSTKTLTVNGGAFNGAIAINVTGGSAIINKGTISGTTYGVQTNGGSATIEKLAAITGDTKALNGLIGSLTVNNGKFTNPDNLIAGTVTFNAGYFQTATGSTALGKQVWRNTAGPEAREGYAFFAGDQAAAQASNVSVCRIGMASYRSLEEALAYANNSGKDVIIIMENDYTLPVGYYTLPANATLIVPMSDDQDVDNPIVPRSNDFYTVPYKFRRLTLESGVELNVLGTIELTCVQNSANGVEMSYPNGPYGHMVLKPGSHITLGNGSEFRAWGYVTGDGTKDAEGNYLSGEIDARRGSTVREQFQMGDWKGGNYSLGIISDELPHNKAHLFPIYEYFIQNIESPVKYHPGSSLITATSVFVEYANAYANEIKVVGVEGEPAMFLMNQMADAENTWVRKWYDAKKDQQVYEVNSGAQLGSLLIELGSLMGMELSLNSAKFVLPLTSNFKIHLLSGNMEFTQSTSCLPGMEVEVDKESTISIVKNENNDVVSGALYFYDSDQWGKYVYNGRYGSIVQYSATWALDPDKVGIVRPNVRSVASAEALGDAKLIVHGTFRCAENCAVYTTAKNDISKLQIDLNNGKFHVEPVANTGGASIISTNEDAGTFIFDDPAPTFVTDPILDANFNLSPNILFHFDNENGLRAISGLSVLNKATGSNLGGAGTNQQLKTYGFQPCTSARLQNGDGTFAETAGVAQGKSYCYMNDRWTQMDVDEDEECFMVDNYGTFYAKPAEYVAVVATKDPTTKKISGNEDHTFSDAAGAGRLFILMDNCQWWEVEKKDNLYHCIHPNNDTYYYWDDSNPNSAKHKWVEKRFVITWQNWDGTEIKSYINTGGEEDEEVEYSVTYGTMAEFLGTNPTREPNIDYTYDFTGWTPELGPVKSDVTYTATYNEQPRKYTVIFLNEGGVEIERQFLTHNEMPSCENVPTRTGFTLEWSPAIAAVTGDATYTAKWLEEPPTEYAITFYDYDGVTKLKPTGETPYMVAVGSKPDAPDAPANKPATNEFTYVFDRWWPMIEEVSATSAKSYVAVYSEVAKTYTISYYKEDGSTLISTESLPYGATPTPPVVSKEDPAPNTTYTLVWKNRSDANKTIQTVTEDASYYPYFSGEVNRYTRYTVTLSANISAGVTLIGAGTYDKGESVTIQAIPAEGYKFVQWNDGETNPERVISSITENLALAAEVRATAVAENLEIPATGKVTLTENTTKHNLVITSNGDDTSGELIGADYLTLTGDAYFDLNINAQAKTWYAIAVPWRVSVADGILVNDVVTQKINTDFYLISYNSAERAANGPSSDCWTFENNSCVMQPGTLYMIYMTHAASTIRFKKQPSAPISTPSLTVHAYTSDKVTDAGWNGIANPALYHAFLNPGANTYYDEGSNHHAAQGKYFGQKYIPGDDRYEGVDMSKPENVLIVGKPIFVQVETEKTVVAYDSWSEAAKHAPRRAPRVDNAYYEVHISAGEAYTDRLYLQTMEDKEDRYVIGLDLAKAGISNKVAQMWVNRYNAKLCVNTTAPVGKTATYPLGISVPENGTYQISSATEMQANQELYVTRNGSAIWNLAYGPYTVTLDKGTYSEYGIKLIQSNAPAVTTGVDQTTTDKQQIQKVVIDNHVYIVREGELYTITGQKVK